MSEIMNRETVLSVEDLTINFRTINGMVKAVRGISFDLKRGETVAIVGESGSGKSVSIKAIMGILAGNAVVESGRIMYEGQNLLEKDYRGFSYHNDARLDMRMDTDSNFSAYNVVNEYSYEELVRVLREYGEEKYANEGT